MSSTLLFFLSLVLFSRERTSLFASFPREVSNIRLALASFSSFSFFSFAFLSRSSRRVFARSISRARRSRIEEEDFIDDDINNDVVEGFALLDDEEVDAFVCTRSSCSILVRVFLPPSL